MLNCIYVGIGGFIGAIFRYLLSLIQISDKTQFPIITMITNIIGAFLIGLISAFAEKNGLLNSRIILLLKTGVCGGFTTFSTFSLESLNLIILGKMGYAIIYIILSIVLCLGAVMIGKYFIQNVL